MCASQRQQNREEVIRIEKDLKKLRKALLAQGARINEKKSGWMIYPPDKDG